MEAIGPLQLRVMNYIWNNGPSTVHQVHSALNEESGAQKLAYTTILTVMRNLARREILDQQPNGRSHTFEPLISDEDYKVGILRQIRKDLFNGRINDMLKLLAADKEISSKNRKAILSLAS